MPLSAFVVIHYESPRAFQGIRGDSPRVAGLRGWALGGGARFREKNKPSEKAVKDLRDCVLASILQRPKSVFHSILPADFRKMGDF